MVSVFSSSLDVRLLYVLFIRQSLGPAGSSAVIYCYYAGACCYGGKVYVCVWEAMYNLPMKPQSFDGPGSWDSSLHSCFLQWYSFLSPTIIYSFPWLQCSDLW